MEETEKIIATSQKIKEVMKEVHKKVVGQEKLVRDLIIGLAVWGHVLLEWVPGVAKTLTVETLSKTLKLHFKRIQFTPDLLPSDVIWTQIYNHAKSSFEVKKWPVFTNFLLADEINRSPSKVQAALLEAMAEKQVTIGDESYKLTSPFIVLATQNPIEQSGTYKLPEAELDRFLLKTYVWYPTESEEQQILQNLHSIEHESVEEVMSADEIMSMQSYVGDVHISQDIYNYITDLVFATRKDHKYLSYGISPRGSIALMKSSKALAFLEGRDFVIPEDVKEMAKSALSHRLVLNYEAIAADITSDDIIDEILANIKIHKDV